MEENISKVEDNESVDYSKVKIIEKPKKLSKMQKEGLKALQHLSDEKKKKVLEWVKEADSVCFFLGAGMSVASGVPTFRGKYGLWTFGKQLCLKIFIIILILIFLSFLIIPIIITAPLLLFFICIFFCAPCLPFVGLICLGTPVGWKNIPCCVWPVFKYFFYDTIEKAKPNDGHLFIKYLGDQIWKNSEKKKDIFVVTQNVDALEEKCGFDGEIYQLHGNYYNFYCNSCQTKYPKKFIGKKLPLRSPACTNCGRRVLRTGCLLFNDGVNPFHFPFNEATRDLRKLKENDLFIIIGTSATVYPACEYPRMVCCRIVEINILPNSAFEFNDNEKDKFCYIQCPQDVFLKHIQNELEKNSNNLYVSNNSSGDKTTEIEEKVDINEKEEVDDEEEEVNDDV